MVLKVSRKRVCEYETFLSPSRFDVQEMGLFLRIRAEIDKGPLNEDETFKE